MLCKICQWEETAVQHSGFVWTLFGRKSIQCTNMTIIRLWRSWLAFPARLSASSYSRPCWQSFQAFWPRRYGAVSSVEAHSLILHVDPNPPASSCSSASEWQSFFYYPGLHLCFGHFHFFAREQPPAARRSAPYLDIQRLERVKQSKSKCDKLVEKKKRENVVTKFLTLAAGWSRLCVYSMKLKFNICHVTWWSRAWIPT